MTARPFRRYRVVATYGPQELFLLLRRVTENRQRKSDDAAFDFDWLKRAVVLSAIRAASVEEMLDQVVAEVSSKAAPGLLLPGPTREENGRFVVRAGVLLQTPDLFAEQILAALSELGCTAASLAEDGVTITIPPTKGFIAMDYESVVTAFPMPPYIRVEELAGD